MIYISAPYSHKDKNVVEKRMSAVYEHFANLMMKGYVPVTPLMAHAVVTRHDQQCRLKIVLFQEHHRESESSCPILSMIRSSASNGSSVYIIGSTFRL